MTNSGSHSKRILIIDDQPADLSLLAQIFDRDHFVVIAAISAKVALRFLSSQAPLPDIVLLDVNMPGINGHDLCLRMKADPRVKDIPVIFLSVEHEISDKAQAFALGGVDFIVKPFHAEEVMLRVNAHLALRDRYVELEQSINLLANQLALKKSSAPSDLLNRSLTEQKIKTNEKPGGLTEKFSDRERQLLALLNDGLGNKDIAKTLFLSEATVKWHFQNIFLKLGVNNRSKAIIEARKHNLV